MLLLLTIVQLLPKATQFFSVNKVKGAQAAKKGTKEEYRVLDGPKMMETKTSPGSSGVVVALENTNGAFPKGWCSESSKATQLSVNY